MKILLADNSNQSLTKFHKKEIINGATAIWYKEGGEGLDCNDFKVMFFGNNRILRFSSGSLKLNNKFEKIVSTFKFITSGRIWLPKDL